MAGTFYGERSRLPRQTRRSMLRTTGAVLAGGAVLGLNGCSSSNNAGNSSAKTTQAPAGPATAAATSATRSASPAAVGPAVATPAAGPAVRGGTFRWNFYAIVDVWDPHWNATSFALLPMLALVFSKLVKQDSPLSNNKIVPDVVQSWEQLSDTTLLFHLRQGVKFHNKAPMNGRELVAADVKWNIERQRDSTDPRFQRRYQYLTVTDIQTPDKYSVQIQLKAPLAPFLSYLASDWAFMVGREVVDQYGDANREEAMIGTGPFIHQEFKPDVHHLQVRNPDYFIKDQPYLDAFEALGVSDAAAVEAAFRTKKIDLGSILYPSIQQLRKDFPELVYQTVGSLVYNYVRMSVDRAPFNDVRVRQALSAAMNRKKSTDFTYFGFGTLNGAGLPSNLKPWGLTEDQLSKYPGYPNATDKSIADARKLMEAAGYSDSKRLKFKLPTGNIPQTLQSAEIQKDDWSKIYVDVEIAPTEYGPLLASQTKHELDIWRGQDNPYSDPDDFLYGSFRTGSSRNFFGYSNPEVDALLDKQRVTLDQAARKAIVDQIQVKLMDELPQIGMDCSTSHNLWWPYFNGRKLSEAFNTYQYAEVWLNPNDPSWKGRPT